MQLHLDKILKGINNSAVIFGQSNQSLEVVHDNEQPAWIIFSAQPEPLAIKGKILLIIHVSPFHLKEWLMTPMAKKHQQLVAVSDPALKVIFIHLRNLYKRWNNFVQLCTINVQ